MCGTMVCLKETCCRQTNANNVAVCETVNHALECGGGTGIFLAVNSSTIVVIRGKRACIWGSIYLDKFGEEDKELKRGKPLYLHPERYQLLEHQWLTQTFDHTNRKWVFHRDAI
jgi:E3 ubiquitin-protein ligase UBR3